MTVRGCQQRLRQDYMVVDRHGFPCALKGVGDKRNADVGHEVEVTGTLTDAIRTSTRSEKQGSNPIVHSGEGTTLEVLNVAGDVRKISDRCLSHQPPQLLLRTRNGELQWQALAMVPGGDFIPPFSRAS
jgi:hypothetical protein